MLAFLGTGIAMFSSSMMFYYIGKTGLAPEFSVQESFAFGALISATDPVAVLSTFKELNLDINLYSLIFGESIFNDAIALVMYKSITQNWTGLDFTTADILKSIGHFFWVFIMSVLIGAVSALLIAYILKK